MREVLIKGMEMPRNCEECFCTLYERDEHDDLCFMCTLAKQEIDGINTDKERAIFCPLIEITTQHGDLIDKEKLYEQTAEWEAQALEQASKLAQTDNIEEWRRWHTILNERTAFKHNVYDAPVVIEGNL